MNMLEHLNRALSYIEEHLVEDIDFREAAKRAYCSEHHFKRMFSFLAGMTLSEYVRRRRLTLAASELHANQAKIIDVAMKYGYQSPDAFARAFQLFHGVTPSEARLNGQPLKAFPPMTFQLTIRGGNEMNYRIEHKDGFRIVGIMQRVPLVFNGINPEIAAMAKRLDEPLIARLKALSNVNPRGMISASANFSEGRMEEKGELDHYIGVATTESCPDDLAQSLAELEVAAGTWAVFESVGPFPATLQSIWGRIYAEWFPSSSFELAEGPEIVWHESPDFASPTFRSEIWIPVVAREP